MFWDPFDEMARMHEEMDRMFGRMLGGHRAIKQKGKGSEIVPFGKYRSAVCNVEEKDNRVVATFEIPGIDKDDIEVMAEISMPIRQWRQLADVCNNEAFGAVGEFRLRIVSLVRTLDKHLYADDQP